MIIIIAVFCMQRTRVDESLSLVLKISPNLRVQEDVEGRRQKKDVDQLPS